MDRAATGSTSFMSSPCKQGTCLARMRPPLGRPGVSPGAALESTNILKEDVVENTTMAEAETSCPVGFAGIKAGETPALPRSDER